MNTQTKCIGFWIRYLIITLYFLIYTRDGTERRGLKLETRNKKKRKLLLLLFIFAIFLFQIK